MDFVLQVCAYLIGIPLQILTISALLRGTYRRFPLVFLYTVVLFLTSIAELPLVFSFLSNQRKIPRGMRFVYFFDEAVLQLLTFAVVISLIYEVTARVETRRMLRLALVSGAFLTVIISGLIHYSPDSHFYGPWVTPWSRDLKLCATILVLALWAFLISSRKKDRLLLMLSGGLGILCSGEAIGESLRQLSTSGQVGWLSRMGGLTITLANIAFLYIWWASLRQESAARPKPRTA